MNSYRAVCGQFTPRTSRLPRPRDGGRPFRGRLCLLRVRGRRVFRVSLEHCNIRSARSAPMLAPPPSFGGWLAGAAAGGLLSPAFLRGLRRLSAGPRWGFAVRGVREPAEFRLVGRRGGAPARLPSLFGCRVASSGRPLPLFLSAAPAPRPRGGRCGRACGPPLRATSFASVASSGRPGAAPARESIGRLPACGARPAGRASRGPGAVVGPPCGCRPPSFPVGLSASGAAPPPSVCALGRAPGVGPGCLSSLPLHIRSRCSTFGTHEGVFGTLFFGAIMYFCIELNN